MVDRREFPRVVAESDDHSPDSHHHRAAVAAAAVAVVAAAAAVVAAAVVAGDYPSFAYEVSPPVATLRDDSKTRPELVKRHRNGSLPTFDKAVHLLLGYLRKIF